MRTHWGKTVALVTQNISDKDVAKIREKFKDGIGGLQGATKWIRQNIPEAYKLAFRSFDNSKLHIKNSYDLNSHS